MVFIVDEMELIAAVSGGGNIRREVINFIPTMRVESHMGKMMY